MEIVSYVVNGELTHKDSTGNTCQFRLLIHSGHMESLNSGSVQYMSAGTGIMHSEMNNHESKSVRFIQIWIKPDQRGYAPNYGSKTYDPEDRHNKLLQLISKKANASDKIIG
jgi:redox-sensitive bicupin YhaK (pirin superfamily)